MKKYSLLIIPENHLESKRFHFSKLTVHLGLLSVAFFLIFSVLMTWGFLHYRQVALDVGTSVGDDFYRSELVAKLHQLEDTLKRTQQYALKVESLAGVDASQLKLGVGPVAEEEDLGKYLEKVKGLPKPYERGLFAEDPYQKSFYARFNKELEELSQFALSIETRMNEVYELTQDKFEYWASTPSIWPVKGWMTSDFGTRLSPTSGAPQFHQGLDIAAPYGSTIYAPADGIASFVGYKGGYGYALILDHGYGIQSLYGHTSGIIVPEGKKVKRGQSIARVGSSGSATGSHLHYEIHVDGMPTDPLKFLLK